MPTYEYACDDCEHEFEEFQSITARPLKKCPECGKRALRRLISAGGGVIFKGSGFYETDYRSEAYKKDAEADKPGESDKKSKDKKDTGKKGSSEKAESKTESKKSDEKEKTKAAG